MMNFDNKRDHKRYITKPKEKVHFAYDVTTQLDFQIRSKDNKDALSEKHCATMKNVSVVGLCFESENEIHDGDDIHIKVYFPGTAECVDMEGEVRWIEKHGNRFDAGVELETVEGKQVAESVHFDDLYQIEWSEVLETVFGKFKINLNQRKK